MIAVSSDLVSSELVIECCVYEKFDGRSVLKFCF